MNEFLDVAAKVLMIGIEGQVLSLEEKEFLRTSRPAGVVLFGRNIDQSNQKQCIDLTGEIYRLCQRDSDRPKTLIAIDQEGGRVSRIKEQIPNLGPALNIDSGSITPEAIKRIREYGQAVGLTLLKMGINVNFAPVVDIFTEPRNHAIGDRCFGKTPEEVILRAGAYLQGLTEAGVWGCIKHFPGQGHALIDTHHGTAHIDVDLQTLKSRELIPFQVLKDKAPMVMVAHGIFSSLDSKEASRSSKIMKLLLREEIGYRGLVVTDDMLMGAIPQDPEQWKDALIESIKSGADLLLVCKGLDRAHSAWQAIGDKAARDPSFFDILKTRAESIGKLPSLIGRGQKNA